MTSPSSKARPWRSAAAWMSAARSSPARTSGMPSTAVIVTGIGLDPQDTDVRLRPVDAVDAHQQRRYALDVAAVGQRAAVDAADARGQRHQLHHLAQGRGVGAAVPLLPPPARRPARGGTR